MCLFYIYSQNLDRASQHYNYVLCCVLVVVVTQKRYKICWIRRATSFKQQHPADNSPYIDCAKPLFSTKDIDICFSFRTEFSWPTYTGEQRVEIFNTADGILALKTMRLYLVLSLLILGLGQCLAVPFATTAPPPQSSVKAALVARQNIDMSLFFLMLNQRTITDPIHSDHLVSAVKL